MYNLHIIKCGLAFGYKQTPAKNQIPKNDTPVSAEVEAIIKAIKKKINNKKPSS